MNPDDQPVNVYDQGLIVPARYVEDDILGPEASGEFITQWIKDVSDDPLTLASLGQAKAQWDRMFPEYDERDVHMFIAGMSTLATWWAELSVNTRTYHLAQLDPSEYEEHVCPECHGLHDVYLNLDEIDNYIGRLILRLATTVWTFEDDADLADAFADLVESITREDEE